MTAVKRKYPGDIDLTELGFKSDSQSDWDDLSIVISQFLGSISCKSEEDVEYLTKIIIRLPCVLANVDEQVEEDGFLCSLCDLEEKSPQAYEYSENFYKKIVDFSRVILNSNFRKEKYRLISLLERLFNHTNKINRSLLQIFIDYEQCTLDYNFKAFFYKLFAKFLREAKKNGSPLHFEGGEDRDYFIEEILKSFNIWIGNPVELMNPSEDLSIRIKLLIASIRPFAEGADDMMGIGLIKLILRIISLMLYNINLTLACQALIKEMAESNGAESFEYLCRFRMDIAEEVVTHSLSLMIRDFDPDEQSHMNPLVIFLRRIEELGRFNSRFTFCHHFIPSILARALPKLHSDEKIPKFLIAMQKYFVQTPSEMFMEYFSIFYVQLVLFNEDDVVRRIIRFLVSEVKLNFSYMAKNLLQTLTNELISYLYVDKDLVLNCFNLLILWNSGMSLEMVHSNKIGKDKLKTCTNQREEFIASKLMGVFVFVESKLKSQYESIKTKQRVLNSLIDMIDLMGPKHMTPRRNKLLSLLGSLTSLGPVYCELLISAWSKYFHMIDRDSQMEMAVPIIYAIMPLRETLPNEIDSLIDKILQKTGFRKEHLLRLSFLSDFEDGNGTNVKVARLFKRENANDMTTFLKIVINETTNKSALIICLTISKLKELVLDPKYKFHEKISLDPDFHQLILELIRHLLDLSKGNHEDLSAISSECLGLIGPIDPYRFDYIQRAQKQNFSTFTVISMEFKVNYLVEVCKFFKESLETQNFDIYAYCIQHLISVFGLKLDNSDPIWTTLPEDYRKLIEPIVELKYSQRYLPTPDIPTPIFNSRYGMTFIKWISNFVLKLISFVKNEVPKSMFEVSKILIQKNEHIAKFLLPFVATYAIIDGSEAQIKSIETEIKYIFDIWLNDEPDTTRGYYPIRRPVGSKILKQEDSINQRSLLHASQVIFLLLNHLDMASKMSKQETARRRIDKNSPPMPDIKFLGKKECDKIDEFIERISNENASVVALHCEDYPRALMYIENSLKENPGEFQSHLNYIQNLYIALEDLDSADGISAKRIDRPTALDELLHFTTKGKLEESTSLFERLMKDHDEITTYETVAEIYLSIDQPNMALNLVEKCTFTNPLWNQDFIDLRLEIAWRSLKFGEIGKILKENVREPSWMTYIGRMMSGIYKNDVKNSLIEIKSARELIVTQLGSTYSGIGSYIRTLDYVAKLQILTEIEEILDVVQEMNKDFTLLKQDDIVSKLEIILIRWKNRFGVIPETLDVIDPLFHIRKTLLSLLNIQFKKINFSRVQIPVNKEIQEIYLFLAKKEIKKGNFERAKSCIEQADPLCETLKTHLYNVKILVQRGLKEKALLKISGVVDKYKESTQNYRDSQEKNISPFQKHVGYALLQFAKLNEELKTVDYEVNLKFYHDAAQINLCEKNFFHLASFYDRFAKEDDHKSLMYVVKYYCQSLHHGVKFIYQSLFRALTIWFEFGTTALERKDRKSQEVILREMTASVEEMSRNISIKDLYLAISQLNSRICHPNEIIWYNLKKIIKMIILKLPNQTLWWMMASYKSMNSTRKERCKAIFRELVEENPNMRAIIQNYINISQDLVKLAETSAPDKIKRMQIKQLNREFWTKIKEKSLGKILIPIARSLNRPLPDDWVSIDSFESDVNIMPSLQRPKKVNIIGSDGKTYGLMCKSEDDLRKDYRTMEVNNVMNMYLSKDEEARQRQLHIRIYAVVALTEKSGICEWVQNLHGLRPIITSIHRQMGVSMNSKELARVFNNDEDKNKLSFAARKEKFLNQILPAYPPVLNVWFNLTFPDPIAWYTARLAFIRTSAVMSIVGYMMGLGDRHGENILIDSGTGDAVHVDFNCLFNKGEEFRYAERVPFRLTHNMINAMGPLGYDGGFRRSCEITLSVIQNQKELLLSILRPFVFDPFLEGSNGSSSSSKKPKEMEKGEQSNKTAIEFLRRIRLRIEGSARNFSREVNIPLSKEALVNYLINESISPDNLCQMFLGWASYL